MPLIDVGTPPASLLTNEWETQEIRFHEFEGLPAEKGSSVNYTYSPEFMCFGHKWRLQIYPGGGMDSDDGMVGASLIHQTKDEKIIIKYGLGVKIYTEKCCTTIYLARGNLMETAGGWRSGSVQKWSKLL